MSGCCVSGCHNRYSTGGLKFYRIPRGMRPFQSNRRRLWLQAINRVDWTEDIIRNARVCSAHFISGEASLDSTSPDFVPSLFPPPKQTQNPRAKVARLRRKRKKDEKANASETQEQERSMDQSAEDPPVPKTVYEELHLRHWRLQADFASLRQECDALRAENEKLKDELQKPTFSYSSVKSGVGQLVFFTGLTSVVFEWLLTKITGSVDRISHKLTLADHLLVVLMKLRLGLCNTDLAFRFNVSKSTVSNIVRSWVPAMALVLKPLIKWPSKGAILRNMPRIFRRKFTSCRCILDCAEVSIARPGDVASRAQTWSRYKHTYTRKYLIGVTPAGAVSFLSPGWAGRVSDKQITAESGFCKLLEPQDEVLAERVFLIRDELEASGATLRVPHFTKGKKPISAQDSSRRLSRVRIHVERVIGRWKQFKILQTVIPESQVNILDDVVTVCGALTNLGKSVFPK